MTSGFCTFFTGKFKFTFSNCHTVLCSRMNTKTQKKQQQRHLLQALLDYDIATASCVGINTEPTSTVSSSKQSIKIPSMNEKQSHSRQSRSTVKPSARRKVVLMKNINPNEVERKPKKCQSQTLFKVPLKPSFKKSSQNQKFKTSTPVDTPLKSRKPTGNAIKRDKIEREEDTESTTSQITAVSSVPSSLVDLLRNYNSKLFDEHKTVPKKNYHLQEVPEKLKDESFDETMTTVANDDVESANDKAANKVKKLFDLTDKLSDTVGKIISSGDTECLNRMALVVMAIQRDLMILQEYLPSTEAREKRELELKRALEPLVDDKASLQRKIRILNQTIKEREKEIKNKTTENLQGDLNLELATLQCMNSALNEQIRELNLKVLKFKDENEHMHNKIETLKESNESFRNGMGDNIQKQQKMFTEETTCIKKEVADAMLKIESLSTELREADLEKNKMTVTLSEKDAEIARLSDLNRGLQSSVTRLLADLRKTPAPSHEMSSMILRTLDGVLKPFPKQRNYHTRAADDQLLLPPFQTESCDLALKTDEEFRKSIDQLTRRKQFSMDDFRDLSPAMTISTGQSSNGSQRSVITSDMYVQNGSAVSGPHASHFRDYKIPSVMSSMMSFTSHDEREFAKNLSMLDIDLDMLEHNIRLTATN